MTYLWKKQFLKPSRGEPHWAQRDTDTLSSFAAAQRDGGIPSLLSAIAGVTVLFFLFFFILSLLFWCVAFSNCFQFFVCFLSVSSYVSCKFLVRFFDVAFTIVPRFWYNLFIFFFTFLVCVLYVSLTFPLRFPRVFHDSCRCVPRFLFVSVTFVKSVLDVSSTLLAIILYVSFHVIPCFSTFVLRFRAFSVGVFVGLFDSFVHVKKSCCFKSFVLSKCCLRFVYVWSQFCVHVFQILFMFWFFSTLLQVFHVVSKFLNLFCVFLRFFYCFWVFPLCFKVFFVFSARSLCFYLNFFFVLFLFFSIVIF